MKYDDLFLCRMMMRMYSLAATEGSGIFPNGEDRALWSAYRGLESQMIGAFVAGGIRPTPVSVVSDFNGDIKKVLELAFCYAPRTVAVPVEIYDLFPAYGVKGFAAPPEPPVIRFGYTGRCYDYKTKAKLITDGLQIGALGKIVLDIFALKQMTKAGVSCRLTHELLHVFGVSEDDMARYKPTAFFALREEMDVLSQEILSSLNDVEMAFKACTRQVAEEHPQWVEQLEQFGNRLYLMGFPASPQNVLTAAIRLPEGVTSRNTVDWCVRDVLYM